MISFFTGQLETIDVLFGVVFEIVFITCFFILLAEFGKWITDFNGAMKVYREQKKAKKTNEDIHRK